MKSVQICENLQLRSSAEKNPLFTILKMTGSLSTLFKLKLKTLKLIVNSKGNILIKFYLHRMVDQKIILFQV